jgi:hypothetical protein
MWRYDNNVFWCAKIRWTAQFAVNDNYPIASLVKRKWLMQTLKMRTGTRVATSGGEGGGKRNGGGRDDRRLLIQNYGANELTYKW